MIRVLHFGDMHLDSPFSGVSAQEGERLRNELRQLFCEIMQLASGFDAVLIPGDLFDCGFVSPDTLVTVKEALGNCGRPVVISPGNHDPYKQGSVWTSGQWPENVMIFSDEHLNHFDFCVNDIPVTVWGWAFTSDRLDVLPLNEGLVPFKGRINLICGHGDISSPITKYCPVTPTSLAISGCEYAALGHIHKAPEPAVYGKTLAAYCGFPEGRSWDEPGQGSVLAVTVEEERIPAIEKIPTGHHRYEIISLDITGESTDESVIKSVSSVLDEYINASVLIKLEGTVSPDYKPNLKKISENSCHQEGVAVKIEDNTIPVYGSEYLEKDMTVVGEFYRSLLPKLNSSDIRERTVAAEALRIGLLALEGRPF